MQMKNIVLVLGILLATLSITSCSDVRIKDHPEWKQQFDSYGVDGCFEYYDNNKETAHYYNKERCAKQVSPASTFKIFNSLVGLETAVAPDEQLVIKWDGVVRSNPDWNKDMTMAQAFKVSCVPYYQELARRIGAKAMQHYIDTVKYGNMKIGKQIDTFWLDNTLLISPDEQVGFIKRLYHGELPFSERTQRIVRGMMLQEESNDYKLYYKTGWSVNGKNNLLWVVGYTEKLTELKNVETGKIEGVPHPYFFAMNFSTTDTTKDLKKIRLELLHKLIDQAGIGK
jgi:beta-lactamase class D